MQFAPFVHPQLALAAVAAAVLPIIIHLIHRRRYHRMAWAAMGFLRAASRRSAHRILLEQWILMLLRVCIVLLLGLAVARPFFPSSALASLGQQRTHRVVLLDNSCSMGARLPLVGTGDQAIAADVSTRFDDAMRVCQELIASFSPGDAVSLVLLSHPAKALIHDAAYDRRRVRDRLARVELSYRSTDLAGGLRAALAILADSDVAPRNRVCYIVSDFPMSSWDQAREGRTSGVAASLAQRLADEADVVFCRVGSGASDNIAVTGLESDTPVIGRGMTARLTVEVANYSNQPVSGAAVKLIVDDRIVHSIPLDTLGPFATRKVGAAVAMGDPGMRIVKATIDHPNSADGDRLAVDNDRRLVIRVREALPVLLVDGRPGATALTGQTGYLSAALSPVIDRERRASTRASFSAIDSHVVSASAFPTEPLSEYGVIVLCNVPRLEPRDWVRLHTYVGDGGGPLRGGRFDPERSPARNTPPPKEPRSAGGGGLLVFAGDLLDAANYNEYGYAGGAGVLPCAIAVPSAPDATRADEAFVRFASERLTHPAVSDFADQADSSLFLARVHRHLTVTSSEPGVNIPLRYSDGAPALLTKTFTYDDAPAGQLVTAGGRVMLCTTTADTAWTNLPAKGDYVALMVNIVTYLGGSQGPRRTLAVGDSIRERLAPGESGIPAGSIRFRTPGGDVLEGHPVLATTGEDSAYAVQLGPLELPGPYVASVAAGSTAYAVNIDPRESDLRGMNEEALAAAIGRDVNYIDVSQLRRESSSGRIGSALRPFTAATEFAGGLLIAVLALLLIESWLAARFGRVS